MEILEMLAMSGADLNAKNKNDETPSGIFKLCIIYIDYHRLNCFVSYCSIKINTWLLLCFLNIFKDICEDAEIRERIEQLKSEQESKRLAEAQRRRVRRSQSNNTRCVSFNYTVFHVFFSRETPSYRIYQIQTSKKLCFRIFIFFCFLNEFTVLNGTVFQIYWQLQWMIVTVNV